MFPYRFSSELAPNRSVQRVGAGEGGGHEGIGREVHQARAGGSPILVLPVVVLGGWILAANYTLFVASRSSAPEVKAIAARKGQNPEPGPHLIEVVL
jgi:hypothetical protein